MRTYLKKITHSLIIIFSINIENISACTLTPNEKIPTVYFPDQFQEKMREQGYVFQVLALALKHSSEKYGPCEPRIVDNTMPIKRVEFELSRGTLIQVADFTVTPQRNERFLPVKIPITKGLIGNRMLLVRKGESKRFANVTDIKDLAKFTAGQGKGWSDTKILRENKLNVKTTNNVKSIVNMLTHHRVDYFPRGTQEVKWALEIYQDQAIELEPRLIISYPQMVVFYVSPDKEQLRERLSYGLNKAIDSGEFDTLFFSHPTTSNPIKEFQFFDRTVFYLCNPLMPSWFPITEDKYWLRPWPKTTKDGTVCQ